MDNPEQQLLISGEPRTFIGYIPAGEEKALKAPVGTVESVSPTQAKSKLLGKLVHRGLHESAKLFHYEGWVEEA